MDQISRREKTRKARQKRASQRHARAGFEINGA
jgi:hypothetical protein